MSLFKKFIFTGQSNTGAEITYTLLFPQITISVLISFAVSHTMYCSMPWKIQKQQQYNMDFRRKPRGNAQKRYCAMLCSTMLSWQSTALRTRTHSDGNGELPSYESSRAAAKGGACCTCESSTLGLKISLV